MGGRDADSAVQAPLALVEDALMNGGDFSEVEARFRAALADTTMRDQVPFLEASAVGRGLLFPNTLVRFRGLVQDMWNPEYYVGCYRCPGTDAWKMTQYMDSAFVPEEADTQLMERRPILCISVPGEADWCSKHAVGNGQAESSSPIINHSQAHVTKRPRESISEEEMEDAPEANVDSRRMNYTTVEQTQESNQGSSSQCGMEFPWEGAETNACLIKIYGSSCESLKLNDVVDFYGIYTVSPELTNFSETDRSFSNQAPPGSQLPRIHCIFFDKVVTPSPQWPVPGSQELLNQAEALRSHAAKTRHSIMQVLCSALGGDELAAEFVLLQLLSRVQKRTGEMVLGSHSLNLAGCLPEGPVLGGLCKTLSALCPRVVVAPMTLESFNNGQWTSKKNYDTGRLEPGILQVADGTHMLLDETRMQTGKLQEAGVKGLQALKLTMETQQLEYDFQYYSMNMPTDISFIILSHGKSMLDADTLVPLRMKSNPSDALSLVDKNDLGNLRHYLWSMRGLPNEAIFKDEIIANIQDRMVSMRQKDKNLGPKDFHRLLNLSKLMAASYGRPMELADWDRVQALDAERMVRLSLS